MEKFYTNQKLASGVFVINISKISSSNPSIKEDEGQDGDDGTYTYTHLSNEADQMITIFKGKLIYCQLENATDKKD